MKKFLLILVPLLLFFSANTAVAVTPGQAIGLWQYSSEIVDIKVAGCNTFAKTIEEGIWTGTFEGTSVENGQVVLHCSGAFSFNAIVSFEGSVDGKYGTMVMSVVGSRPDGFSDWNGRFVILGGTGDLTNLHGQGIWYGPGASGGGWGDIYYEGNYHFEP